MGMRVELTPMGLTVKGAPQLDKARGQDVWDAGEALGSRDGAPSYSEGDMRAIARMHHTGVSCEDLACIFRVGTDDIERIIWLYARLRLGKEDAPVPEGMLG